MTLRLWTILPLQRFNICQSHRSNLFKLFYSTSESNETDSFPQSNPGRLSQQHQRRRALLSPDDLDRLYPVNSSQKITLQEYLDSPVPFRSKVKPKPTAENAPLHILASEEEQQKKLQAMADKAGVTLITDPNFKSPLWEFYENGEAIPEQTVKSKMNPTGK